MTINERLNKCVHEKGIRQNFLAQKIGVSEKVLSKMLTGKRRIQAEEFLKMCKEMEIDPKTFEDVQTNNIA